MFRRLIASLVCVAFIFSNLQYVHAQDFSINQLPVPGTMVGESTPFAPLALKGLIVNPQKPLEFQFIVDTGRGPQDTASIKDQANQLVKYFLAGLTIPEGDLWVNLSPYEKDRMVPTALGQTDLGRDLLAQDYILKQLTASLIYPEKDLGKEFWSRVYAKAQKQFGTTNVPVNTFNKVWILPDQAQVYENHNAAYVTRSTLKVMLDEDYTALQKHVAIRNGTDSIGANIVRQIILPEIEKEVNTGKNFAPLRQIYQALILAKWYKETIQNGLLDVLYTNKNKVAGVNLNDPAVKEQIYQRYIQAYKKGAFNYIKEDPTLDGQVVPRKYFSGGITKLEPDRIDRSGSAAMISTGIKGTLLALTISLSTISSVPSLWAQNNQGNTKTNMTINPQGSPVQVGNISTPKWSVSIKLSDIMNEKVEPFVRAEDLSKGGFNLLSPEAKTAELKKRFQSIVSFDAILKKVDDGEMPGDPDTLAKIKSIEMSIIEMPRLQGGDLSILLEYLNSDSILAKVSAAGYLERHADNRALPTIFKLLKSSEPRDRVLALAALSPGNFSDETTSFQDMTYTKSTQILPAILPSLYSFNDDERIQAVKAFRGSVTMNGRYSIYKYTSQVSAENRENWELSLLEIAHEDTTAFFLTPDEKIAFFDFLRQTLDSPNSVIRDLAYQILDQGDILYTSPIPARILAEKLKTETDPQLKLKYLDAIGQSRDSQYVPLVRDFFNHAPDQSIDQYAAALALALLNDQDMKPYFQRMFGQDQANLRFLGYMGLSLLGDSKIFWAPENAGLMDDLKKNVLLGILDRVGTDKGREMLVQNFENSNNTLLQRTRALAGLVKMDPELAQSKIITAFSDPELAVGVTQVASMEFKDNRLVSNSLIDDLLRNDNSVFYKNNYNVGLATASLADMGFPSFKKAISKLMRNLDEIDGWIRFEKVPPSVIRRVLQLTADGYDFTVELKTDDKGNKIIVINQGAKILPGVKWDPKIKSYVNQASLSSIASKQNAAMLTKLTIFRINRMSDVKKIASYLNNVNRNIRQAAIKRLVNLGGNVVVNLFLERLKEVAYNDEEQANTISEALLKLGNPEGNYRYIHHYSPATQSHWVETKAAVEFNDNWNGPGQAREEISPAEGYFEGEDKLEVNYWEKIDRTTGQVVERKDAAMNTGVRKYWTEYSGTFLFFYRLPDGQKRFIFAGDSSPLAAGDIHKKLIKLDLSNVRAFVKTDKNEMRQVDLNDEERKMMKDLDKEIFGSNANAVFNVAYDYDKESAILSGRGGPYTIMNDFEHISVLHLDDLVGQMRHFPNNEDIYFGTTRLGDGKSRNVILKEGQVQVNFKEGEGSLIIYRQGSKIYVQRQGKAPQRFDKQYVLDLSTNGTRVFHIYQRAENPFYLGILNETGPNPITVTYNNPNAAMLTLFKIKIMSKANDIAFYLNDTNSNIRKAAMDRINKLKMSIENKILIVTNALGNSNTDVCLWAMKEIDKLVTDPVKKIPILNTALNDSRLILNIWGLEGYGKFVSTSGLDFIGSYIKYNSERSYSLGVIARNILKGKVLSSELAKIVEEFDKREQMVRDMDSAIIKNDYETYNRISNSLNELGDYRGNDFYSYDFHEATEGYWSSPITGHMEDGIYVEGAPAGSSWVRHIRESVEEKNWGHFNTAMLVRNHKTFKTKIAENGGIDLNQINVLHNGRTVNVKFDPAQLKKLMQGGFEGFTPVIINITPISSPFQLLGIAPTKQEVLAKA